MNILINCSNLKIGGGIQVAHSFINHIKDNKNYNFIIVISDEVKNQLIMDDFGNNFKFINYNIDNNPLKTIFGKDRFLNKVIKEKEIEVVFSIFGPTYWKPKVNHIVGYAKPHYVYKDSPFFNTISVISLLKIKIKEFFHMSDFKNNNNVIITENEDVSLRLGEVLKNKKIYTVTNYYNQIYDRPLLWDPIKLPNFKGLTLLTISANYPHKNLSIIEHVIGCLNRDYPEFNYRFVLTLNRNEIFKNTDNEVLNRIIFLGKVNVNQCPSLYKQCDAVFLPTLLECFSATYAEAMRMERPILTSNLNFARGLCADAAIYFDPLNPDDIANNIVKLALSGLVKDSIIEKGKKQLNTFDTSEERARKYLEIIINEANHSIL